MGTGRFRVHAHMLPKQFAEIVFIVIRTEFRPSRTATFTDSEHKCFVGCATLPLPA